MHLVTTEDDLYGSNKRNLLSLCPKKNILAFNLLKKNNLVFWQKKQKRLSHPKPQKIKWSLINKQRWTDSNKQNQTKRSIHHV